jgi:hypothetical protein
MKATVAEPAIENQVLMRDRAEAHGARSQTRRSKMGRGSLRAR